MVLQIVTKTTILHIKTWEKHHLQKKWKRSIKIESTEIRHVPSDHILIIYLMKIHHEHD